MAHSTAPNEKLAAHLAETGFSAAGLARRVKDLAKHEGKPAPKADHTAVARWLAGQRPRAATASLIAAVFTQALGRRITETDLGFAAAPPDPDAALTYQPDLAATLAASTDLTGSDTHVHRRKFLTAAAATATVFAVPAIRYLTAPDAAAPTQSAGRAVGMGEAAAVREVTGMFRRLDNQLGGGHGRTAIVTYLRDEAMPLLKHGSYTAAVGAALFSAVSELMLLAGWMAFDLEQHPVAMRYLIQALKLSEVAGDRALGSEILNGMSHQAAYLRQGAEAVDMARAAAQVARRAGQPVLVAESLASEAHGHALASAPRSAAVALLGAEDALTRADREQVPVWLGFFDEPYLHARTGRVLLDANDPKAATTAMTAALAMKPGFDRGKVFNLAVLAQAQVHAGDVDRGCATALRAAKAAATVNSKRAVRELTAAARSLTPYRSSEPARNALALLPAI
jgi:hypothetical protein